MKTLILKLMMLLVASAVSTPLAFSQNALGIADTNAASVPNANSEAAAADEKLPFMQQEEESRAPGSVSTGSLIFKTLGAMLIVIGIIFFGAWGLKKFGFGGLRSGANADAPELSIVSSVTVGNGRTISSVKFGNRILLVGSTPQSFTLLADGADEEPLMTANPRSVAELLAAEDSFEDELAKADAGLISLFQGGRS